VKDYDLNPGSKTYKNEIITGNLKGNGDPESSESLAVFLSKKEQLSQKGR
jgi:hypothetical protein